MSYGGVCNKFKWIYGYEDTRDPWINQNCHWCLNLDETSMPKGTGSCDPATYTGYSCKIVECDKKKNAWNESRAKGQQTFVSVPTRWYKGKLEVIVLIKGKRNGKRGPITWLVRSIVDGKEFVTIPRLCWKNKRVCANKKPEVCKL